MSLLPLKLEPSEKIIFNPDTEPFSCNYDDDNGVKTYTIPAIAVATFPTNIADHITKHLANKLYQKRGNKINYEVDIEAIKQEIQTDDHS